MRGIIAHMEPDGEAATTRARRGPLSVVEAGDVTAPALVLLHGIGSSGDAFGAQFPAFADRWHLLAPDAPGYGESDDPSAAPGIDGFADAVARLLDDTGIDRAVVLGVSWGGVIATRFALRHPNRLRALVLSDTSRGSGFDPERTAMMAERAAQYAADPVGFVRDRTPLLVADTTAASVVADIAAIMDRACRMPGYGYAAASL
ncbi:MAG: alpha/beta hydrolase, partial [Acidimicrobiales bacterium]|nr:alpha/beta hydrolase [Acidimicrobiales bacterium]